MDYSRDYADIRKQVYEGMKREKDWLETVFGPKILDSSCWPMQIATWLDDTTIGHEVFMYGATIHSPNIHHGSRLRNLYHDTAFEIIELAHKQNYYYSSIPSHPAIGTHRATLAFWELVRDRVTEAIRSWKTLADASRDPLRVVYGLIQLADELDCPHEVLREMYWHKEFIPELEPVVLSIIASAKEQIPQTEYMWKRLLEEGKFERYTKEAYEAFEGALPRGPFSGVTDWEKNYKQHVHSIALRGMLGLCLVRIPPLQNFHEEYVDIVVQLVGGVVEDTKDHITNFYMVMGPLNDIIPRGRLGATTLDKSTPVDDYNDGQYDCLFRKKLLRYAQKQKWPKEWRNTISGSMGYSRMMC